MRPPTRPRPPGERRSAADRLVTMGPTMILAVASTAVLAVAGIALLAFTASGGGNVETSGPTGSDAPSGGVSDGDEASSAELEPLDLPLDLELVGFDEGMVEKTGISEGPEAVSYCNNAPTASGLVEWQGNRLTEDTGRQRVAQMVARFESSFDAAAYVAASSEIIDCEEWETASNDDQLRFSVSEQTPATIFGDETRQFDLEATADGPELFLRTLLVRSGNLVAQFTFVSANRQDLGRIDDLAEVATDELGF